MRRPVLVLIVVAGMVLLGRPSVAEVETGDTPSLDVTTIDGETVRLEDWRGKVVLVDFWASWCAPCRKSFPFYQGLADKHDEYLRVLAVSVDEKRGDVEDFLEEHDVSFSIAIDSDHRVASTFEPPTIPTAFLIGPEGEVQKVHSGFESSDRSELASTVDALVSRARNAGETGGEEVR